MDKTLRKKYGEYMIPASQIVEKEREIFSISPRLDLGLGGGIPEGSWFILSGRPKIGKTVTALQLAANMQQCGRKVFFVDAECRLKQLQLQIKGLDLSKVNVIKSNPERIYSGDELLEITKQIIRDRNNKGSLVIFDSLSILAPKNESEDEVNPQRRTTTPKMVSDFCKQNASVVPMMDIIFAGIQHLYMNTSGYGEKWLEDGGVKIQHQADIKIRCTEKPKEHTQKVDGQEIRIGQKIKWDIIHSALGPPGISVESFIKYGTGVDIEHEKIQTAIDFGIIDQSIAWYQFNGQKFHGENNLRDYLSISENMDKLEEELKTIIL